MYEITREKYIEKYGEIIAKKYYLDAGDVWDVYHARVEFALDLIPTFRIGEEKVTGRYLKIAFGVTENYWNAMVFTFERLKEALDADKSFMELKSEIALLKGVNNTEHQNAKMIEMMLKLYNKKYKKADVVEIEIPETISFKFEDTSETDEELDEYLGEEETD